MRDRFASTVVFTIALALLLSPLCWAQEGTRRPGGQQAQNPTAGAGQNQSAAQDRNQAPSGLETIRGVIAAIAAEGEIMLDYRTNTAVRMDGAYLTIVGSPVKPDAVNRDRQTSGAESDKAGASGNRRHNVYIAWSSPRTKIFESTADSARSDQNQRQSEGGGQKPYQTKQVSFDQLQVGDHVEIQFSPIEESGANNNMHLNQQMRQKHGRHRTFVGYATSITVRPATDHNKFSSRSDEKSVEQPK
jgi:hypothetical protein